MASKKGIDRYKGQSLINYGWSNSKWTTGSYYQGADAVNPTSKSGNNYRKSKKNSIGLENSWSDTRSNSSSSRSNRRGSRHLSISSASDQSVDSGSSIDAQSLVGVGLIATNAGGNVRQQDYVQNHPPRSNTRRRRHRKSNQYAYAENYYDSKNGPWPICDQCNNEYYFYYCDQIQDNVGVCECSFKKALSAGDYARADELWKVFCTGSPINYYYIMEATYSFNHSSCVSKGLYENVPPPPERTWITSRDADEQQQQLVTLSAMSYNVLCEKYLPLNLHDLHPSWALNWDHRKKMIMQQLKKYQPDVISLQEVETQQYWTFFKPKLEALGYSGIFSARSRARTMGEEERLSVDGCALFWKADKFELHQEHVIEFTKLAIAKAEGSEHMLNRVMTRDNIALAAVLRIRRGIDDANEANGSISYADELIGTPLVVCSTHIHWDPEFCDVKLVQSMMLVQELTEIMEQTASEWDLPLDNVPLIICGDLNSTEDSSVHEFLTTGSIEATHDDFKDFRGQACLQKLSSGADVSPYYSHELQLISAYDIGSLPFTNYTCDFNGVIDYIFASPSLICQSVLGPLDTTWFQENKIIACPCPHVPSDHIPLMAQYAIMPPTNDDRILISS